MTRFILAHPTARANALRAVSEAADGFVVTIKPPTRSIEQNAAQWPILDAFSSQLKWPVNGHMVTMTSEEWKDVLSAGFKKEQVRLAMGLDGGVVMLGKRTSSFTKAEFSEWLDYLNATAALRGVSLEEQEA